MLLLLAAAALAGLGVITLVAAYLDVISFTIPNWLTASLAGLFIIFAAAMYFNGSIHMDEVGLSLAAGAIAFVIGLVLFLFNALGGGDVKYLAAGALWAAPVGMMDFILAVSVAGALLALAYLFIPRTLARLGGESSEQGAKRSGMTRPMPYGVAISAGLGLVFWRWALRLAG